MAATRPRIVFTPDADTLSAIDRLATFRGVPRSAIVQEYMGLISPALHGFADDLQRAHSAEEQAQELIRDLLSDVHDPFYQTAESASHILAVLQDKLAQRPPSSNTGVTTPDEAPVASPKAA